MKLFLSRLMIHRRASFIVEAQPILSCPAPPCSLSCFPVPLSPVPISPFYLSLFPSPASPLPFPRSPVLHFPVLPFPVLPFSLSLFPSPLSPFPFPAIHPCIQSVAFPSTREGRVVTFPFTPLSFCQTSSLLLPTELRLIALTGRQFDDFFFDF